MDANPLGMGPGAKIHNSRKLIGVRVLPGGQHRVQFPDERVQLSLKSRQLLGYIGRIHSVMGTNADLDVLKTWLTAKSANKTRVRYGEVFHAESLPAFSHGDGWVFPSLGG
jgi:hypothetical protein